MHGRCIMRKVLEHNGCNKLLCTKDFYTGVTEGYYDTAKGIKKIESRMAFRYLVSFLVSVPVVNVVVDYFFPPHSCNGAASYRVHIGLLHAFTTL